MEKHPFNGEGRFCTDCGNKEDHELHQPYTKGTKIIKMYLHGNKEDDYEKGEDLMLSKKALENFVGVLYEVAFDVEVDLATGNTKIIAVDGRKLEN